MVTISGAASMIAVSTVSCSVTRRRPAAVAAAEQSQVHRGGMQVDLEQLDVAVVLGEERPDRLERALDARLDVVGMQAVHDQQAPDELVVDEALARSAGASSDASATMRSSPPP